MKFVKYCHSQDCSPRRRV